MNFQYLVFEKFNPKEIIKIISIIISINLS